MNIECPSCQTRYSVEDSRIPPSGVTIKCPGCSHSFVVKKDAPSAVPESSTDPAFGSSAAPPPSPSAGGFGGGGFGDTDAFGLGGASSPSAPAGGGFGGGLGSASSAPATPGLGQSGMLDFIDDTANKAGVGIGGSGISEVQIRRANGSTDGPMGVQRAIAMLRAGDLVGNEQVSDDGRNWRPLSAHPELGRVLGEMQSGYSDLPQPAEHRDLPGPRIPHQPAPSAPSFGAPPSGGDNFSNLDDLGDLGGPPGGGMGGMGGLGGVDDNPMQTQPVAAPVGGPLGSPAGIGHDLGSGEIPKPMGGGMGAAGNPSIDPSMLEVGEIPQLPSIWDQYKKPIIAFAAVMAIAVFGLAGSLTGNGIFFMDAISAADQPPPPPPPPPPKPKGPRLADANEIRPLIDEGSYEAFRTVLASLEKLGLGAPDNLLMFAKAYGLATIAYGDSNFPSKRLFEVVEQLKKADLSKALGGNLGLANLEVLKARSALQIVSGEHAAAVAQLDPAFEQNKEDKELAYLLGLARQGAGNLKGALEAFDRAVVIDTKYAPALHAIGTCIAKHEELGKPEDAAWWLEKAMNAEPSHSRSGLQAAEIYSVLKLPGDRRRLLAQAADGVDRGLPPDDRARLYHDAALAFALAERPKDGLKYAKEAARLKPAESRYIATAAVALIAAGKIDEAMAMLPPAISRTPRDVSLLIALAKGHMAKNEVPEAYKQLETAKKAAARDHHIYLWEGRFHYDLGRISEARISLTQSKNLSNGSDPRPLISLARLELANGNIDGGLKFAQAAVKADPGNPRAHSLVAKAYLVRSQLEKAQEAYEKALRLDSSNLDAQIGLANALRDAGAKTPNPAESEQLAQAIPIYIEALREHADDAMIIFEYGRALELQNNLEAALQLYRDASALDPKDPRPHLTMVAAFMDGDKPKVKAAKESLAKAAALKPDLPAVKYWTARTKFLDNDFDEARRMMDKAIEKSPKNASYFYWRGQIHLASDSIYEAIGDWERAIQLNSRHAEAYRSLGQAEVDRNGYAKARQYFDKFRMAAPKDQSIWVEYGKMYVRQNKNKKALDAFKRALEADPKNALALVEMGEIFANRGEDRKAVDYFRKAAEADPYNGTAVCRYAVLIGHSRAKLGKADKDYLQSCIDNASAPDELKRNAQDILDEAGT